MIRSKMNTQLRRAIAHRRTADGTRIELWEDAALTHSLGVFFQNSPHAKTPEAISAGLRAGWLVLGEVELYDFAEVPELIAAARWAAARDGLPGTLRARLHREPRLTPVWTTIESDRDGRARIQCWRLPRLRWPGLAVWRDRGRYSLWTEIQRTGSYEPTGIAFSNLRDLSAHLLSYGA